MMKPIRCMEKSKNRANFWLVALLGLALGASGCGRGPDTAQADTSGQPKAESQGLLSRLFAPWTPVEVPAGTTIVVTLDHALASDQHEAGDDFSATVAAPVEVNGKTVVPRGAPVRGRVVDARESGRLSGVARLRLELTAVEVGGNWYELHTSAVTRSGESHRNRNIGFIGGGTAAGATIGAIAGGGKGAAIGAASGAAAGTATAAATGKKDIVIPAESSLSFKLTQPATMKVRG